MKISLAWKWVAASLLIETFMLSLMVIKNLNQLEEDLETQTLIRLNEQKVLLQSALAAPLAQMDYATITAILTETKNIPNVDYLAVVDIQNNCISSVGIESCNKLPQIEIAPFSKESLKDQRYDTQIAISLASQNLGTVYLGLSTKFYVKAQYEMIKRSILIATIELILSAILLIAISKWIIKNLVRLTHMANEISRGNYSQRIELSDSSEETSKLQNALNIMVSNIQKNVKELEVSYEEQKNLSNKLKSQLEKNDEQKLLLMHQSRMAALGEMITNIAHQWRQPLNGITMLASALKLNNELKILDEKDINYSSDNIVKYATYLSNTIDDFRNFIKNDSVKKDFLVQKSFNQAKDIISTNFVNLNIKIITKNNNDLIINGTSNELIQVFINILNNAKDILVEKNIDPKIIEISFYKENEMNYITIQDNAGGVREEIIEKIFDPYFTTKHQSQGTGIGLYMSSKIIHEHFDGEIVVQNEELSYEGIIFKGAKFIISIPSKI